MTYQKHQKRARDISRRVNLLRRKETRLLDAINQIERERMNPALREQILAECLKHMGNREAEHLTDWLCLMGQGMDPKEAAAAARKKNGMPPIGGSDNAGS